VSFVVAFRAVRFFGIRSSHTCFCHVSSPRLVISMRIFARDYSANFFAKTT
jgi:hypothetical protein